MNHASDYGYSIEGQLPSSRPLPRWAYYTQAEYDAFGWSTLTQCQLEMSETHGLDYESARDATPRWFGVSFGNGNDGVSHTFPRYFCRCTADQAYTLAKAALVATLFNPPDYRWAIENCEVDGEAEYTITATIYDPPDDGTEESDDEYPMTWSEGNGAWIICEVFPVDVDELPERGDPYGHMCYPSLADCFDAAFLASI